MTAAVVPMVHKRQTQAPGIYWFHTSTLQSRTTLSKEPEVYFKEVLGFAGVYFTSFTIH